MCDVITCTVGLRANLVCDNILLGLPVQVWKSVAEPPDSIPYRASNSAFIISVDLPFLLASTKLSMDVPSLYIHYYSEIL